MWNNRAYQLHSVQQKIKSTRRFSDGNIENRSKELSIPYFIGVCGGSGSGKSSFCQELVRYLGEERILVISQDSYYKNFDHLSFEKKQQINFDHPDSIEFPLLANHLDQLLLGKTVQLPCYDFNRYSRLHEKNIASPKPIIVVEGILLFTEPAIEKRLNHKIFIDVHEKERFSRRLIRDVRDRGRTQELVFKQIEESVRPMHNIFVEPCKVKADEIISGEVPFEQAVQKLCLKILSDTMYS